MNTFTDDGRKLHELDAERELAPGRIVFRAQTDADRRKLAAICPRDQTLRAEITWLDDTVLVIGPSPEQAQRAAADPDAAERKRLLAMGVGRREKELKTLCGELGIAWDKEASPETMVERVLAARGGRGSAVVIAAAGAGEGGGGGGGGEA